MKHTPPTLRDRFGAIGCGALAVTFGLLTLLASTLFFLREEHLGPTIAVAATSLFAVVVGLSSFWIAIRAASEEDDDILHGDRGTALAVAIVVLLVIMGFMVFLLLNRGFWQGLLDGHAA